MRHFAVWRTVARIGDARWSESRARTEKECAHARRPAEYVEKKVVENERETKREEKLRRAALPLPPTFLLHRCEKKFTMSRCGERICSVTHTLVSIRRGVEKREKHEKMNSQKGWKMYVTFKRQQ